MVTDDSGAVKARYDYLPFGEELLAGTGGRTGTLGYSSSADGFRLKYTGQARDAETGLDYMHLRYYDPVQGRFQGADPANAGADAGNPQTWNGYAYVNNNPLNYVDPSGLALAEGAAVGGTFGGPVGAGIGAAVGAGIDLGIALWVLFRGGQHAPTLANVPFPNQSTTTATAIDVNCGTVLPNGQTIGELVRLYRARLLAVNNMSIDSAKFGGTPDPIMAMTGTYASIARERGPIDFKSKFRGKADGAKLGRAGNFAYYAIGTGVLPDWEMDAGAGAYAVQAALRRKKQFSSLTGPMFSDISAASVRGPALQSNGCRQ